MAETYELDRVEEAYGYFGEKQKRKTYLYCSNFKGKMKIGEDDVMYFNSLHELVGYLNKYKECQSREETNRKVVVETNQE